MRPASLPQDQPISSWRLSHRIHKSIFESVASRQAQDQWDRLPKLDDLDRLYALVKEKAGHIDVLFANAGSGEFAALGQITEEHFDKTFATNVKGAMFTVQKALPLMKREAPSA